MKGAGVLFVLVWITSAVATFSATAGTPDGKLVRLLTGKNETVRMRAIVALQQDYQRKFAVLDELITAAQAQVERTAVGDLVRPSTVELLYLIGTIDKPESESLLVDVLDAENPGIAMVAADTLGKNKFYGAIEFLKQQVNRPEYKTSYGFRFNLIRSLAQMEHPDAVEFLDNLKTRIDGQLRHEIDKLLAEVTEDHFQGDAERFAEWEQTRQSKVVLKQVGFEPESLQRIKLGQSQYYGIDIHAKRMMFIIDHSGSMKEYWGGMSRLQRAKSELVRVVRELPPDAEFAILFFETTVRAWRNELVRATDENKREAIAFVGRLGFGHRTNTYGALRKSLEFDDKLEAVYLLTDGLPTTGEIVAQQAIVTDILHRNRFRHLNFNTIGIAVGGSTAEFLRTLAEQSAGVYCEAK